MKTVKVEFAKAAGMLQPAVQVWFVAASFIALGVIAIAWKMPSYLQETSDLVAKMEQVSQKRTELEASVRQTKSPKQASIDQARQVLSMDLNKCFAVLENVKLQGAQLRSVHLDTTAKSLKLEYSLRTMEQTSALTEMLNAGYDRKPWSLVQVGSGGAGGVTGSTDTKGDLRGTWIADVGGF